MLDSTGSNLLFDWSPKIGGVGQRDTPNGEKMEERKSKGRKRHKVSKGDMRSQRHHCYDGANDSLIEIPWLLKRCCTLALENLGE